MMERRKVGAITAKQCKTRRGISLPSKKKEKSDIRDDTDLNQTNDKYLMQL